MDVRARIARLLMLLPALRYARESKILRSPEVLRGIEQASRELDELTGG